MGRNLRDDGRSPKRTADKSSVQLSTFCVSSEALGGLSALILFWQQA